MLTYIFVYMFINFLLFLHNSFRLSNKAKKFLIYTFIFILLLFVGLRHEVGGDWEAYLYHFTHLDTQSFIENLLSWDPGYVLVEYIAKYLGIGIYGVNTLCAIIFFIGFQYFIKAFKINPFYAYLIAFPYLIMVVVNGYTRQGVAIGLVMGMYGAFYEKRYFRSLLFFITAVLFHKTAIISGLIFLLRLKIKYYLIFFGIAFLFYKIHEKDFAKLWTYYFLEQMQSRGGLIRILTNLYAGILFFIFYKKWKKLYDDYQIWLFFSLFTIMVLFFTLKFDVTTVGDRILLYFYPLQIVVFSRVIAIIKDRILKHAYFIGLILLYWGIILVWLNFADHREYWIPYNNLLLKLVE